MDDMSIDELNQHKVVIVGGTCKFAHRLQEILPNFIIYDAASASRITKAVIANCEMVFFYSKYMGHSIYRKCESYCKSVNVPMKRLISVNKDLVIKQICQELQNMGLCA